MNAINKTNFLVTLCIIVCNHLFSQTYPTFGPEKSVTINGLTFDAMEPFISLGGDTLFFNSLNSGGNTNLYYAAKIDDTTFTYVGLVGGCYDPSPNHLDAVASMDGNNNFFWVTTRGWNGIVENLHHGKFSAGNVTDIGRVYGNFYVASPQYKWIVMDAAISYDGNLLYYSNARLILNVTLCSPIPCAAVLGIAQKVNDSTFTKLSNSDALLSNVNDTATYIVYAPQVTQDGLELYFTRIKKSNLQADICVSVRTNTTNPFSLPIVLVTDISLVPEAPTLTTDKSRMYYHKKDNAIYKIFMRYRDNVNNVNEIDPSDNMLVFPNPAEQTIRLGLPANNEAVVEIYDLLGQKILAVYNVRHIDISALQEGMYNVIIRKENTLWTKRIVKL